MSGTILFVASNPTAIKFDFAGELTAIREASSKRRPLSLKLVSRWSVSAKGLKSAVETIRPEIVHLLSPGVDQVTNALVLADTKGHPEYAQPDAVAGAFAQTRLRTPKLVVLNTCHSRSHGEAIAKHAGCVIAMDGVIYDNTAIHFARELYSSLAFGESIQSAFERARAVVADVTPTQVAVPVLLSRRTDSTAITFASRAPRPVAASKPDAFGPAGAAAPCAKIFCSYSHKDEKYRAELETHLALLARQGAVHVWHDRQIEPGADWAREIDENINHANVVLLLISADFLASQYCYGIEMNRALARATTSETRVVPILVRKCDLQGVPFGHLQWLPSGAKPVKNWPDRDSAWTDVAKSVRKVVQDLGVTSTVALSR
jgi:TIR domain/CHAT domain